MICPICKESDPNQFGICRARKSGRNRYCRACARNKVYAGRIRYRDYLHLKKSRGLQAVERKAVVTAQIVTLKTPAERVVYALRRGFKDREAIRMFTKLTSDDVSDQLAELYDSGKAKPNKGLWYLVA